MIRRQDEVEGVPTKTFRLLVFPDYGDPLPLWFADRHAHRSLPAVSPSLRADLMAWQERWEAMPDPGAFPPGSAWRAWWSDGGELVVRLREEFGGAFEVVLDVGPGELHRELDKFTWLFVRTWTAAAQTTTMPAGRPVTTEVYLSWDLVGDAALLHLRSAYTNRSYHSPAWDGREESVAHFIRDAADKDGRRYRGSQAAEANP